MIQLARHLALQQAAGLFSPGDIIFALERLADRWPAIGPAHKPVWEGILRPALEEVCYHVSHVYWAVSPCLQYTRITCRSQSDCLNHEL